MALGQIVYGPISDSFGRKKAIYIGISIFIFGSLVSLFSMHFNIMLLGRVCQGFGVASSRVVTLAMIRDQLEGREMGRVMSLIMVLFIMVPAIAPSIGQGILLFAGWRAIFGMLLTQYRLLYSIGAKQKKQGFRPPSFRELFIAWREEKKLIKQYPSTD
jgi:DHA1 family bicyclomycin/chloramphenicol resistance-like MFS transporter